MQHTLLQTDTGYECSICGRTWKKAPDDDCVGVRMYPFGEFQGLMTANQLGIMGYRSERGHLPAPAGYYWRGASKRPRRAAGPVFLYDPAQATKKKGTTKQRVTKGINSVAWPLMWCHLLDRYIALKQEKTTASAERNYSYANLLSSEINPLNDEIIRIASCLVFGTFDESLTGPCVTVTFPPALFRRRYDRTTFDEEAVVARLIEAYKKLSEEKTAP